MSVDPSTSTEPVGGQVLPNDAAGPPSTPAAPPAAPPAPAPAPAPRALNPPLRFGLMGMSTTAEGADETVYRGAYPRPRHIDLLRSLGIRTIVSLTPKPLQTYAETDLASRTLLSWIHNEGIVCVHIPTAKAKEREDIPLSQADCVLALRTILRADLAPLYVHDLDGDSAVPLLQGVLRRVQGWDGSSIKAELQRCIKHDSAPDAELIPSSVERFVFELGTTGRLDSPPPAVPYPSIILTSTSQPSEEVVHIPPPQPNLPQPPWLVLPRRSTLPQWIWPAPSGEATPTEEEPLLLGGDRDANRNMLLSRALAHEDERSLHCLLDPWAWHALERTFAGYWSSSRTISAPPAAPGPFPPELNDPGRGRRKILPDQLWSVRDAAVFVGTAAIQGRLNLPIEHPQLPRLGFDPEDPRWYLAHPMSLNHPLRPELVARLRSSSLARPIAATAPVAATSTAAIPGAASATTSTKEGRREPPTPTRRTHSTSRLVPPCSQDVKADTRPQSISLAQHGRNGSSSSMAASADARPPSDAPPPDPSSTPSRATTVPTPSTSPTSRPQPEDGTAEDESFNPVPPGAWPSPLPSDTREPAAAQQFEEGTPGSRLSSTHTFIPISPSSHLVRTTTPSSPQQLENQLSGLSLGQPDPIASPSTAHSSRGSSPTGVLPMQDDDKKEGREQGEDVPVRPRNSDLPGYSDDDTLEEDEDEEDEEEEEEEELHSDDEDEDEDEEEHDDRVLQALDLDGY